MSISHLVSQLHAGFPASCAALAQHATRRLVAAALPVVLHHGLVDGKKCGDESVPCCLATPDTF